VKGEILFAENFQSWMFLYSMQSPLQFCHRTQCRLPPKLSRVRLIILTGFAGS